jgi:hypothetical protein
MFLRRAARLVALGMYGKPLVGWGAKMGSKETPADKAIRTLSGRDDLVGHADFLCLAEQPSVEIVYEVMDGTETPESGPRIAPAIALTESEETRSVCSSVLRDRSCPLGNAYSCGLIHWDLNPRQFPSTDHRQPFGSLASGARELTDESTAKGAKVCCARENF